MQNASIIVVGNEILEGVTLDTNSHWLREFLTGLGGRVRRVVQVRDEQEVIGAEVRRCRESGELLTFTIGGLGPTSDDVTLPAVSQALGLPMERNEAALAMVTEAYRKLRERGVVATDELWPSRLKMAILPRGGRPLLNTVGTAPGVLIELAAASWEEPTAASDQSVTSVDLTGQSQVLICLPGVPAEMRAIVELSLAEDLRRRFGNAAYMREDYLTDCRDESQLASPLAEVRQEFPRVLFKSHAEQAGPDGRVRITVSSAAGSWDEVRERLAKATARLSAILARQRILLHNLDEHGSEPA